MRNDANTAALLLTHCLRRICGVAPWLRGPLFTLTLGLLLGLGSALPLDSVAQDISLAAFSRPQPALANGQSATLLPDGRWLVLGGEAQGTPVATAAIVDSCAGKTTTLPNALLHARTGHTASLLKDGNVLIFGGLGSDGRIVQEAELFNPQTQTFQAVPDTGLQPRARHTATVLADGRVLLAGGVADTGAALLQAELWDPGTQKAEPLKATLLTARFGHYAAQTPNGAVLLWGGINQTGAVSSAEFYDPQTQTFNAFDGQNPSVQALPANAPLAIRFVQPLQGTMLNEQMTTLLGPLGRTPARIVPAQDGLLAFFAPASGQSATLLPDGRWLVLGGEEQGTPLATAAVVDLCGGTTTALPNSLLHARAWHTATLLPDGNVLVFGGVGSDNLIIAEAERFDTQTQTFQVLPDTGLLLRARHTATVLTDGRVLLAGGISDTGKALPQADLWNPKTGKAEPFKASLQTARSGHFAALLPGGTVLVWGGQGSAGSVSSSERYDPQSQRFTAPDPNDLASLPRLPDSAAAPAMDVTLPEDGATGVPIDTRIAARFVKSLRMATLNISNVTLLGPTGQVAASVTPAEDGLLAFLTPKAPLQPASQYTLFLNGIADDMGSSLPFSAAGFTTPALAPNSTAASGTAGSPGVASAAVGNTTSPSGLLGNVPPVTPPAPQAASAASASPNTKAAQPAAAAASRAAPAAATTALQSDDGVWIPGPDALRGDWRAKRQPSPLQTLPPLQAPPGVTALAGQVLLLDGKAAANVTLSIGDTAVRSDATGRFLLSGLPAGWHTLILDGTSANLPGKTYGVFEARVGVPQAGTTNILPYTIWMPRIATQYAVSLPSPTTSEVVVTTPQIPGLELHIPKGTVIRDRSGQIVTQVSITPIPVDRPPFPLPTGYVPVYFTVQPGGAYLQGIDPASASGARVIYPNYHGETAGARLDFWSYDPVDKGWYVYGQGTVSQTGQQIVPDPGVAIYEFTGAMINAGLSPPAVGPPPGSRPPPGRGKPKPGNGPGDGRPPCGAGGGGCDGQPASDGEPVDLATGLFVYEKTDLVLSDVIPLALTRTYRPNDTASRPFGIGTNFPYGIFLWSANQYQEADLVLPDGGKVHYVRTSLGTSWWDAVFQSTVTPGAFYNSHIAWNGLGWDLTLKDGTVYVFGENAPLQAIRDRYGNTVTLTRASGQSGNITRITSPNGRYINLAYDAANRITQATDNIGRTVGYTYDASGRLWKVTDAVGGITSYTYDASHRMLTITDPRGIVYLTNNSFDTNGRVTKQTLVDGGTYQFAYTVVGSSVTQTDVTDPRGNVRRVTFNANGYPLADTRALGKPEQQAYAYSRQAGSNLVLSVTDPLNRVTAYSYDGSGNVASVTRLSGTPNAVTTNYTYEPAFNQVASVTDPLNHTWTFSYDSRGNLTTASDPLNQQSTFTYNFDGQLATAADPLGHTTRYGYDLGDLVSITDALGNVTTRFTDSIGRVAGVTDPLGNLNRIDYDAMDRVTRLTDPLGAATQLAYDANGNLTSVTDPRGGVTAYTYDNKDRVASRTDPLLKSESYAYDLLDNLTSFTDRKGQVANFSYDALNRRSFVGFGAVVKGKSTTYASTVNTSYDAGNRLTQAVDSQSGTVSRAYDGLDRLTAETTPQGSVAYAYDAAGRRTSMTVAGQPQVTYAYDNANRLTAITQGSAQVGLAYDAADRRSTLTLPNGVTVSYGWDDANRLTSLVYRNGSTTLGDLAYSYDAAGQRTAVGGSLAQSGLPQAVASASYNAANRLTAWGSVSLSYDLNGNLTGDGANSYTWDARNRLAAMTGASFQYDPFGRRTAKTVSGATTGFLYDGVNPVQELSGSTPTANLLTGLGVDEVFSRTDSAGARTLLSDALGSTLALTDNSGAIQTRYSYEPFGKTTASGTASTNSFQYTGRENDGTGLYYYRARYYSPTLQRFIAEDPLGMAAGPNLYAYVGGNPLSYVDPLGLDATIALYPGASGFGHIGIGVNSANTTGFYPAPGSSTYDVITGQPVPGVEKADTRTPTATINIRTTPAQDKAIQDFINARKRNPGKYDLNDRNCATTVRDALGAGGVKTPATIYPRDLMRNLQKQYGGQQ